MDLLGAIHDASAERDQAAKASQNQLHDETIAGSHVHALRVAIADAARLAGEHSAMADHHHRLHALHLRLYDQLKRLEQS